ncbi:MAG TPA: DUF6766 family protein [Verrucomicrobiae bacterium]|nr:DUF6766 family protein [Verrucomicrobiae bacterium]
MRNFLRNNGLSLTLVFLFVIFLFGMARAGNHEFNEDQRLHNEPTSTFGEYIRSSHFLEALFENWESEFLQMAAYVVLTAFLFQRGSAESKDPDKSESEGCGKITDETPSPVRRGGWMLKIYENSLSIALGLLFLLSMLGHAISGVKEYNEERSVHGLAELSLAEYASSARFWFESFQNWQSEFLAVLAIVVLSIWLRQKDSAESKEVAAPHASTGK